MQWNNHYLRLSVLLLTSLIPALRNRWSGKQWQSEVDKDFAQGLKRLNIKNYWLIAGRNVEDDGNRQRQAYRVFYDYKGGFFVYLFARGEQGVFTPLTKESALLARATAE